VSIGIDDFGHSAPLKDLAEHLGFTPKAVVEQVKKHLKKG
jgi:transketolase